jgi:flagellar hook assembly protein FlgD
VDVAGRVVRILRDGACSAGTHGVEWDLKDDRGSRVAAGVYFCRIASNETSLTDKIVALR